MDCIYQQQEDDENRRAIKSSAEKAGLSYEDYVNTTSEDRGRRLKAWAEKDWKEKSPFNIFGDAWDWAPWNDRKSKNSLNPLPSIENHSIPESTSIPFDFPPGQQPFHFDVVVSGTLEQFSFTYDKGLKYLRTDLLDETTANYGIPESLLIEYLGDWGAYVYLKVRGDDRKLTQGGHPGNAPNPPLGLPARSKMKISVDLRPKNGARAPWPLISPSDLQPLPIPNREIFPQPAPQFEPEGRPEYPRFPQPDRAPAPQRSPAPSPSPQPSPAPAPMPNPPAPIPLPSIDPTAAPTGDPKPRFDPAPAPGPIGRPSPVPNPANKPFPGKQKNPGDYHFKYYDEGYKAPGVVAEKQREKNPAPYSEPYFPRPDFDACKDPCIAEMHDQSKAQKPVTIDTQSFTECNLLTGAATFEVKTIEVPENQADFMEAMLNKLAALEGQQCTTSSAAQECYAAIPDSAQLKIMQEYPQLVIQYAEDKGSGKYGPPKYSISIPHYQKSMADTKFTDFPAYTKGNHSGILVLTTNAKMIVNAVSATEAESMINSLKLFIPTVIRGNAITSITTRKGRALNQIRVVPRIANYYDTGEPGKKPAWRKYF